MEELELFSHLADGDEMAFRKIFHYYNKRIFLRIQQIVKINEDAEELVQELFLKLWIKREELRLVESPRAWIYKIATNLALDALKKKAVESRHLKHSLIIHSEEAEGIDEKFDVKALQVLIQQATQCLPTSRRQIFVLSREEGLSRTEIAEKLGISESTVKNQLTSALRFVQNFIGKHSDKHIPMILILLVR